MAKNQALIENSINRVSDATESPINRYSTLDAMRGVAALLIVVFHLGIRLKHQWSPEGYLAVDLFFILSGFVIAMNYVSRLSRGMSFKDFMVKRLIRLYPLYFFGTAMGIILIFLPVLWSHSHLPLVKGTVLASLFNLLILPAPAIQNSIAPSLFIFDGPLWSLFCEILVNLLFAILLFRLSSPWLFLICFSAGLYLLTGIGSPLWFNVGAAWSNIDLGMARTLYSFPLGMILWRLIPPHRKESWFALLIVATVGFLMCSNVSAQPRGYFEFFVVFLIFPILIYGGIRNEVPTIIKPIALFFGDISYGIYALHFPLMSEFIFLGHKAHLSDTSIALAFVIVMILVGYVAHHFFDCPARQRLLKWRIARLQHHRSGALDAIQGLVIKA